MNAGGTNALSLPRELVPGIDATVADWQSTGKVRRLWEGDAALWTGADEARWLGWLHAPDHGLSHPDRFEGVAADVRSAGFERVLLLGMGGSSLAPEVLALTFGERSGFPALHVLDSTDPAQVRASEERVGLDHTLFVVASKSGTTLEPNLFMEYFFARVAERVGSDEAGRRFVAITDPGSKLEEAASGRAFRHVIHGEPSIGGRFSALSAFGTVPGAIAGVDVRELLRRAQAAARACGPDAPPRENPGLALGAAIGVAHERGRDKLTLVASPGIAGLGAWLEQLTAESTGKEGRGVIPVDREPLGSPDVYGEDRLFVHLVLDGESDAGQDEAVAALETAGHPVVRISVGDPLDLGWQFFVWEFAIAVAGALIGINPFDQPDVEAAKAETRRLMAEYEQTGALPGETPIFEGDGVGLFADERNAAGIGDHGSLADYLRAHLERAGTGDYIALLAFVARTAEHERALTSARRRVRDARRVATSVGFGPRFLHSTGQAYKGGPPTGVFLQITCDDVRDLPIRGRRYGFAAVKAAQARGDFQVLAERGRRLLRVHLAKEVGDGLDALEAAIGRALSPG